MNKINGAGIIAYYDNRDGSIPDKKKEILYLILQTFENEYDFPKGAIDEGERSIYCALREADEEVNLKEEYIDFFIKRKLQSGLVMYIAKIKKEYFSKEKYYKIKTNKVTGIKEHKDFMWITKEDALPDLLDYLKYFMIWAEDVILDFEDYKIL